jgi:hypothetical protein
MKNQKILYLNSAFTLICAFIFTTIIHDGGHFMAYLFFDSNPTMYHNYVSVPDQSLANYISITGALAGPFISSLQGIIFWFILKVKITNDDIDLLYLWLCLWGFINFFGYLMLTPLSTEGDTGKVAQLLQLSYHYRIIIAIFGLMTIILIVLKTNKWFSRFIPDNTDINTRRKYINALVPFPILTGSVVNSILAFPLPSIISLIYPATSAYVILSGYGVILKTKGGFIKKSTLEERLSISISTILIISFIIRSLLSFGLNFS